jgi:hypothetical protein
MTRINALRTIAETRSMTWGKKTSALVFAAVLIVCSVTVGCSSDKPKPVSSNNPIPVTQPEAAISPMPAPAMQAAAKTTPKKVVHKKPATVNYTDKSYGVSFEYPRRYAIETGDAATALLASNPIPMDFVQPGGLALAAVELPQTGFTNTDFSSAFFNVSVNKTLTADQCLEFAVPQAKAAPQAQSTDAASAVTPVSSTATPTSEAQSASGSKLMLGDLELRATEAVTGEGTRQSDSKYFHVFQNGACYEFGLSVTTVASEDGVTKHVDRDGVFDRLEKILATVKINPIAAPEVTAEAPTPTPTPTPAQ